MLSFLPITNGKCQPEAGSASDFGSDRHFPRAFPRGAQARPRGSLGSFRGSLLTRLVQLDVTPRQEARGRIAVGQADRECIHVPSGFAIIGHVNLVGETGLAVHFGSAFNMTRGWAGDHVGGHTGPVHFEAGSVVQIFQVTPETIIFDAAGNAKIPTRTGRSDNPSATGDEIAACASWLACTIDVGVSRRNNDIG